MASNNNSYKPYGLIIGVALGIIVTFVFKKLAWGILLGIGIAYLLRQSAKTRDDDF